VLPLEAVAVSSETVREFDPLHGKRIGHSDGGFSWTVRKTAWLAAESSGIAIRISSFWHFCGHDLSFFDFFFLLAGRLCASLLLVSCLLGLLVSDLLTFSDLRYSAL